ncbi:MAG TPA: hypothetical protein VK137_21420, partial [Planctomycetaceae bacterium]|nr:hypothetical protein [Planctomycetaceae bacterium]
PLGQAPRYVDASKRISIRRRSHRREPSGSQAGWELSLSGNRVTKETEFMLYGLTLLFLMDPSIGMQPAQRAVVNTSHFTDYSLAYREAQRTKKPCAKSSSNSTPTRSPAFSTESSSSTPA